MGLGLTGFYRKFIPDYARTAIPLYELTSLAVDFVWSESAQKAFDNLKKALTTAPTLMLPKPGQPFILCTDASNFAMGSVLLQRHGDTKRIVAYYSRKFSPAQTRYPAYNRELIAIRDSMLHWRMYLHGAKTVVYTDHASIRHILQQRELTSRQIDCVAALQQFDFEIKYWPGAKNKLADALSRRPDYEPLCLVLETDVHEMVETDDVGFWQGYVNDPYFSPIVQLIAVEKDLSPHERIQQFGSKTVNRRDLFHVDGQRLYWQVADKPRKIVRSKQSDTKGVA